MRFFFYIETDPNWQSLMLQAEVVALHGIRGNCELTAKTCSSRSLVAGNGLLVLVSRYLQDRLVLRFYNEAPD